MRVRLALALLLTAALGCSFVEELDNASAEMDRYSPSARKAAEAKAAAEAAEATEAANAPSKERPGVKLGEWWKNARTIGSGPKDASIVKCTVGGSVQFMRVHDCEMRGGVVGS